MAIGDAAAAAGMTLVDGATTEARTIDTEINRTRDYIANGAGATSNTAAGKVVKRDSNGRISIATGINDDQAATKWYVDQAKAAAIAHDDNYLPLSDVLVSTSGASIAGKVPRYDGAGRLAVGTPAAANQAVPKTYCDANSSGVPAAGGTFTGNVYFPNATPATSGYTVAYLNSDGRLSKGASSERYKKYISAVDAESLGDLFPDLHRFQMRSGDGEWKYGWIAERLAEHPDQQPFVVYAEHDGELVPDSIDFIALLIAQNAQLHQQLDLLAQRLDALEATS